MPANELFRPCAKTLHIRLEDLSMKGDPGFNLWISTQAHGEIERSRWSGHFTGLEVDHLETVVGVATGSWLYHEPPDLPRRLKRAKQAATAHAHAREF